MALSREKKTAVVDEVANLLAGSKLTVVAKYQGTPVKSMQDLRRQAKDSGTQVRVIKNRLFKRALASDEKLKSIDVSELQGQLLYAFNASDEVAPAKNLADFAKTQPQIQFVVGISPDGQLLAAEDVKALASLPTKDQLRAQMVGTIAAPLSGLVNILSGNVRGVLGILNARAEQIKG